MTEFYAPVNDQLFLLDKVVDYRALLDLPAFGNADAQISKAILDQAARFAADILHPLNAAGDETPARLENGTVVTSPGMRDAFVQYIAAGWPTLDMPPQHGGQGLPRTLQAAFAEITNAACLSFAMLPLMQRAAARLLLEHANDDLIRHWAAGLIEGRIGATIAISEPQAGSDVARISTRAKPIEDAWSLSGSKMFITFGDHDFTEQIAHMVLARTGEKEQGTRGLSLFLVPKRRVTAQGEDGPVNNVSVSRVEKKMGLKASPTCVVDFDDAQAFLVGEKGRGLNALFAMVNTMRLEVGIQGVAVAHTATANASHYAAQRLQGGSPDEQAVPLFEHADVRRMLMTMRSKTEGLRALYLETALQLDLAEHAGDDTAAKKAAFLLPICKAIGTDWGHEIAHLGIQVYGGHGYIAEHGMEQLARDIRVGQIYEGTNGIQALDLLQRKVVRDGGKSFDLFLDSILKDLIDAKDKASSDEIRIALGDGAAILRRVTRQLLEYPAQSRRDIEAAATPYMTLAGIVAVGWMWLRMAAVDDHPKTAAKRALARFYADHVMPDIHALELEIAAGADSIDTLDVGDFLDE